MKYYLTVTNRRLGDGALEASSHTRVNTLLLSPGRATNTEEIGILVTLEALGALLDDLRLGKRSNLAHFNCISKIKLNYVPIYAL